MSEPTQRFSNRVKNYVKYRPGYPVEIIDFLAAECQLTPASVIADVGSGTGLLSKLFLDNGNRVFGIEPNQNMRTAGEVLLKDYPNFTSISATAEATTLKNSQVDFVTAGQAFHWFQPEPTVREFTRILRPHGWVVLVWNERQTDTPFLAAYEALLEHYATDYKQLCHRNIDDNKLAALFGRSQKSKSFDTQQVFDFEGIKGRLLSSSYAPLAGHPHYASMLKALNNIFQTHQTDNRVVFKYKTSIDYCQI